MLDAMASWQSLPYEIRLLIWEIVAYDTEAERRACKLQLDMTRVPDHSLAACAAVSCEWQGFFERITFKRLVIGNHEIDQFAATVKGARKVRLGHIRHLRLHIRLADYDASQCYEWETRVEFQRNNVILAKALWPLLDVLAAWDTQLGDRNSEEHGMVLELSAVSQSDIQFGRFRNFKLTQAYPYETVDDLDINFAGYKKQAATDLNALRAHASLRDCNLTLIPVFFVKSRMLGLWSLDTAVRRVPRLDIVRGFVIRRRFYRVFNPRLILWLLDCGLENIRLLRIEQRNPRDFYGLGRKCLPKSLRELHLFSTTGHTFGPIENDSRYQQAKNRQGAALAKASRFLESVTLSYLVHATDFFNGMESICRSLRPEASLWPRLQTLALTDECLSPTKEGQHVLELAGRMALLMPQLRIMELWNAGKDSSCFFRFQVTSLASVTIRGTWDTRPMWTESCRQAWEAVAEKFYVLPLNVSIDMLPYDESLIEGTACAVLRFLELRNKILDPVSRYQLEWEQICRRAILRSYTIFPQWKL